jgi:hypothetical protein
LAQSTEELNLQVHGYATQGFLYSTNNNWNMLDSSDGSAAWTEAVVNISAQPAPRLSIGVQVRYFLLGSLSNAIALDWAQADYKVNEHLGFRAGKVKSPAGLLNGSQDIDPAQLWILLPSSVYALASRSSLLAHYGGVVYGSRALGESLGKATYRIYAGQRVINSDDGLFQPFRDKGITLPNGSTGPMYGATLHWETPVPGLMFGVSEDSEHPGGAAALAAFPGTFQASHFYQPSFYGRYEHGRLMFASEYTRQALNKSIRFTGGPSIFVPKDERSFYAMASYRVASKLTGGVYYSSYIDKQVPVSSGRFQRDWAFTARYDASSYLYFKVEQHLIDGTALGYSTSDNSTGLAPRTRMTLLRLGASF